MFGFNLSRFQLQGKWLSWAITAASCQGFLLLGYDQGVMSGIIGANNVFGRDFGRLNSNIQGLIVSIYDIGCAVESLISFFVGESYGRKKMIMSGGGTMIIGTIILASSTTRAQLLVGRIVTGIGNGFNSSNIPAYQAELAGSKHRGMLLSLQGVVTTVGLCIAYWLDYGLSAVSLVLQIIPLPETPRFLVEKNRNTEAANVLAHLKGPHATIDDPDIMQVRQQIEASIELESVRGPFKYKELLEGGRNQNFKRIVLCCAVNVMQQFTGSNMINYYAPVDCRSFRRRALLLFSSVGLCTCFAIVSILLSTGSQSAANGATAMVFLFQIFLGIGWLPIPWFHPSEVTTTRISSKGQAIGSFINWMYVFTVVQITPIATTNIGWRTFTIFAVFNAVWVPVVWCFFPETDGLELEDIDHLFNKGGFTGGVLSSKGGRTVLPRGHIGGYKKEGYLEGEPKEIRVVEGKECKIPEKF